MPTYQKYEYIFFLYFDLRSDPDPWKKFWILIPAKNCNYFKLKQKYIYFQHVNDGEEHHVSFSWTNSSVKVVLDNGECIPNLRDCQVQVLVSVSCPCLLTLSLSLECEKVDP